jgi:hypothetical protein
LWTILTLLVIASSNAWSAEALNSEVEYDEGRFAVRSDVRIWLPPTQVRTLLTRYENLPALNKGLTSVRVLAQDANHVRMAAQAKVCFLWMCRTFDWVQDVYTLDSGEIIAVIDPAESDFRAGVARWRFLVDPNGTLLSFDAVLLPDFWFPPIVGPWLIKRKLHDAALRTAQAIEAIAEHRPELLLRSQVKPAPADRSVQDTL